MKTWCIQRQVNQGNVQTKMGHKENTKQHGKSPDILEITIHSSEFIFPVNKQSQIGCLNMVVIDRLQEV